MAKRTSVKVRTVVKLEITYDGDAVDAHYEQDWTGLSTAEKLAVVQGVKAAIKKSFGDIWDQIPEADHVEVLKDTRLPAKEH